MSPLILLILLISAVGLLLIMVLLFKINAFIALLVTAIYVGVFTGLPLKEILKSIQSGMGSTLGFVAVVVGLGAIFGQMLESSGGAEALAHHLVLKFGEKNASWAMMLTGFIIAIPVFLDVGFIILVPIVYALARDTNRPILYYGIPLLAGLAVTHSFVPPTPGPVAVAEILNVPLGWVIIFGILLGLPTAIIAGPIFGKYISKRITIGPPETSSEKPSNTDALQRVNLPSFRLIAALIAIPLLLIIFSSVTEILVKKEILDTSLTIDVFQFIGHPFSALIIAALLAMWLLGYRRGFSRQKVLDLTTKSLAPAGIIILITGAGGVLKQVLIDSGIGNQMAQVIAGSNFPLILLAWSLAAIVRVTQGSATVAMITAASIIAPAISQLNTNEIQRAFLVIAIASGATILSHVNDSGFWLVSKYFGMNEKQTLQSWTVMETIISICGLIFTLLASYLIH